jgi:hypothetical protein
LRTATTKQAAQAARSELAAAIVTDGAHRALALKWLRRQRRCGLELDLRDVESEALLFLAETPQLELPELGKRLAIVRWRRVMQHLDNWLVNQQSAVRLGDSAARQFWRTPWRAAALPLHDSAERPRVLPAPLACDGCDDSETDARGRCQRCRLRRRV